MQVMGGLYQKADVIQRIKGGQHTILNNWPLVREWKELEEVKREGESY